MKIIDLFSGCGGMGLGFEMAGFEVALANEKDEWAGETYVYNHPSTKFIGGDVKAVNWDEVIPKDVVIDGVVGGPPCQGFSLSGNRDKNDPRNSLFMELVRCVKKVRPKFVVMENVPGILSMRTKDGEKVHEVIMGELGACGYRTEMGRINAATFGVPQLRERVFIVGVTDCIRGTGRDLIPRWGNLNPEDFITVDQAISDLPLIHSNGGSEVMEYPFGVKTNKYQAWARERSGFVHNHRAMRHTKRIIERFKVIKAGQSVADVPTEHSAAKRGSPNEKSGKVFSQNNLRLHGDRPAPTVAASFQSNFIHPHLDRNFTAREAARLQSFPDRYVFHGSRTTMSWEKNLSQYQQIGNAVPPLLAMAVAENIKYLLEGGK